MSRLDITLLGPLAIHLNHEPLSGFRSNKARALLAYLAVEANRPVSRAELATLLWGDYPEAQARKSLRNVLANLRDLLTPLLTLTVPTLTVDRQTVQLSVDHVHCIVDVVRFDALLSAAESAVSVTSTHAYFSQAIELYNGNLLSGLESVDSEAFESWRVIQQEVRHRQVLSALHQVTEHCYNEGEFAGAITYAQRQLQLEPWQENAHRQLIQALAAQGDRVGALTQFARCQQVLAEELGIDPDAATMALVAAIRAGEGVAPVQTPMNVEPVEVRPQPTPEKSTKQQREIDNRTRILSLLDPLPDQQLFGVETAKQRIGTLLKQPGRPWLVALDGIGGIGKTTLATLLVHDLLERDNFAKIAWVSAKQEEFSPTVGVTTTGQPALDEATLTTSLLEQLTAEPLLTASNNEKKQRLQHLLHEYPTLVIVDNLESIVDYQALVPYLRQLANPSKVLITSRYTLQSYSDIFCYSLTELEANDALALLRHEATTRNSSRLADATDAQLAMIYAVVGGNPLALKLVVGQLTFLPLDQVLANLREARGKRIDQLYTYIYWQAWQMLHEESRQLLLSLPLVPNGTFAQLALASELDIDDLQEALAQLHALSLVQTGGDLDEPRYRLHRLTETFLMQEVLAWQ
ncbi:MAG: AAA family ATPase [Caldilineaceae bacterium]|nr:AAA family ATPase [Caldilineaceae bacterium]